MTKLRGYEKTEAAWHQASLDFAQNAEGTTYFVGNQPGNIFNNVELPALNGNPYVTAVQQVLP